MVMGSDTLAGGTPPNLMLFATKIILLARARSRPPNNPPSPPFDPEKPSTPNPHSERPKPEFRGVGEQILPKSLKRQGKEGDEDRKGRS